MGIVKLFSKHRDKGDRKIPLKYDPRRHSSMTFFTQATLAQNVPEDENSRKRMTFDKDLVRKRDSAIMMINELQTPTDNALANSPSLIQNDTQNGVQTSRKSQHKVVKHDLSERSKRRSKSKVISLYDLKCTCDTPDPGTSKQNRISAPILDIGNSNKYEFFTKEKGDQDLVKNDKPENGKEIDYLDNTLCSELLATQKLLESLVIKDVPHIQKIIEQVIYRMGNVSEKASSLESRLNTVVNVSKQTILYKAEQIKQLENQRESEKEILGSTLEDNTAIKKRLNDIEEIMQKIEFLLCESQIEPTKEEGGTVLQQIESLLAISTASNILNEKLTLELETSDTRVRELLVETAELYTLIENDQKSAKENETEESHRLKSRICDLEGDIDDLNNQLRSSKDTIRLLNQEKTQKHKQLLDSEMASKNKMDKELMSNIMSSHIKHENIHLGNLIEEEDSLTAWQELAQNRFNTEEYKCGHENSKLLETHQSKTEIHIKAFQNLDMKPSTPGFTELSGSSNKGQERKMEVHRPKRITSRDSLTIYKKKRKSSFGFNFNFESYMNDIVPTLQESKRQPFDQSTSVNPKDVKKQQNKIESVGFFDKRVDYVQNVDDRRKWLETSMEHKKSKEQNSPYSANPKKGLNLDLTFLQNEEIDAQNCQPQWSQFKCQSDRQNFSKNIPKNRVQDRSYAPIERLSPSSETTLKNPEQYKSSLKESKTELHSIEIDTQNTFNVESARKYQMGRRMEENVHLLEFDDKVFKREAKLDNQKKDMYENEVHLSDNNYFKRSNFQQQQHGNQHQQKANTLLKPLDYLHNKNWENNINMSIESSNNDMHRSTFTENTPKGNENHQHEELMRIHTRAQLGLIEYLEGENNISQAISRFRKQLENDMNQLNFKST